MDPGLVRLVRCSLCLLLLTVVLPVSARGQEADYLRDVKPVFEHRCFACHGALKQEAGLRLDTAELIRTGGDSGPVVDADHPADSELLARILEQDEWLRMPPEGHPLEPEEIAAITAWIESGAQGPENELPQPDPRDHWAFRPPVRAALPQVSGPWADNPIDAWIAAAHQKQGLKPVGPAEKSLLLRRLYLDLIGVPPTRQQLQAFLEDDRPAAWDRVVDSLLDSPHYGERWGRHWMDIWRYTDWFGLGQQLRNSQKHIWRWRDWIVESLNDDKPYDRMILEMLAADEIAPTDPDTLRATGFLARNYFLFNRTSWLDETIEHTSKAFLGLTINCAKCHDHKYDPISQLDYYRLRAFFEPHQVRLDTVPGQLDLEQDGLPRVFDAHPDVPTYLHLRGNEKEPDTDRLIEPGVPALLAFDELVIEPVPLPLPAHRPALRPFVEQDYLADAQREVDGAGQRVEQLRKQLAEARGRPAEQSRPEGELFLSDPFEQPNPQQWEPGPGDWKYQDGLLVQTQSGASRKHFRTRGEHPQDFEAVVKFRTTGGDMWKSVGLAFDVVDGQETLVYMSAVSSGPKLQISYDRGGGPQYPQEAKQDRPVALNQWYELKVAVRGPLVNVSIDGKHALAYTLPVDREPGRMDLIAFDATAQYDSIEVRSLPAEVTLVDAGQPSPAQSPDDIRADLAVAETTLAAAQLKPESLRAAFAAERARLQTPPAENASELIAAAAKAARRHELALAEAAVAQAERKLAAADEQSREKLDNELQAAQQKLAAARKAIESPGDSYPTLRASLKALEGPDETDASRRSPYPDVSTGRRTALAQWIADPRNPLTARVAVNHIWSRHFGQPLVDPATDFGLQAEAPPMQDLLDWLAVELVDSGWSMKHLHRLMVTSRAYRLSTSTRHADPLAQQADPENQFYWRRRPVRMESQAVRDSVLHLAGQLDLTLGGPTIDPNSHTARRRSLYFTHSRDDRNEFLSMFDDADILRCYRRQESIVPQQALALANSRLSLEMARLLARQLGAEAEGDGALIAAAFQTVLARAPNDQEQAACQQMLDRARQVLGDRPDADERAAGSLVHALLNHNDFVTIR